MKIVHLSDLHIGRGSNFDNTRVLLKGVVKKYERKKEKPAIVITGDITDDGRREQYEMTRALLNNEIPKKDYHVFLCPGNHDFGWNGVIAKAENIERYQEYLSPDVNFPVLTTIGNYHFIGLDSMEDERDGLDRFGAEGEIGKRQLCVLNYQIETIRETSPKDKIIVYLHHHTFYYNDPVNFFLRLKDADELKEVIRDKIDVLLFGHKHVEKRFNDKENKYGISLIVTSKKTTDIEKGVLEKTKGLPVLRFREIDIDKSSAVCVEMPV